MTATDERVRLGIDGPIATITNANVEKHNAFDDAMDVRLFAILAELVENPDVRAIIWRGEGKSFSSGRDVSAIGNIGGFASPYLVGLVRGSSASFVGALALIAGVLVAAGVLTLAITRRGTVNA